MLAVLIGALFPLAFLEAIARLLPVHGGTHALPVNETNSVRRFQPDREFVWSRDWNFSIVNHVKINNFGFVSDVDYDPERRSPLFAVVGDSYVEAFMVPFRETCHGRLATTLDETVRVYSFGSSGSPLSQYVAYAKYARDTFRPDALAIIVVGNDYDESLRKYYPKRGMNQFVERPGDRLALRRDDYRATFGFGLTRASALARYVLINLGITRGRVRRLLTGETARERVHQQELDRTRVADSKRAVDTFLDLLPESSGLKPERILFVVDGIRPRLYGDDSLEWDKLGYEDTMRRYFMANARRRGHETIDLEPAFVAHYRTNQARFDWPNDGHWNALGHEVCFEALVRSELVSREFLTGGGLVGAGEG